MGLVKLGVDQKAIDSELPKNFANLPVEEREKYLDQLLREKGILNQNTAATINTITPPSLTPQTGTPKNNWWGRFWEKILSVF